MDRPNTPKVDEHGLAPVSFPLFETYDKILGRPHLPDEADTEDFLKATSIVVSMPPPSSDVAPTSERDPQLFDSSNNLLASWVDSEDTAMLRTCLHATEAPSNIPRARERANEADWKVQKTRITYFHITQDLTLKNTMAIMAADHNFHASLACCKSRIKEWGLRKNLRLHGTKFIQRKARQRRSEGKSHTAFRVHGAILPQYKVERAQRDDEKTNIESESVNGTIKTPSHVSWATRFTNPRNIAHDGIGPHTIGVVSGLSPGDPALMAPLGSWVGQSSVVSPGSRIDLTTAIAPSSQTDRAVSLDVTPDTSIQARLTYNGLRPTEVELLMHKAKDLEDKKQFPEAYILYKEVIYGFEHFHGLTHFVTIKAILTFASFCISQDIFHEAEDILLKALEAAEAMGTAHSTALELKAYLGRSYTQLGRFGEGEILLKDAKNKIEAMYVDDPKSAFLETRAIDEHLITVYTTRDDFKAAEQEYLRLISKVKTHWVAHHHVSVDLRHNLAHMYQNWRMREEYHQLEFQPTLPCHRAEHNSLELIQLLEQYHEDSRTNNKILCQYDLLRLQYHEINEDEKLERLLERIENFLNRFQTVKAAGSAPLTAGLARSFEKLGMHHKDDWWYTHSQENVDDLHGPNSETAFGQRHQPWVIYLRRGLWPQAEVCFLRAQETASIVLSVDDPLRAKIAKLLRERVWIASCSKCMIR